LSKRGRSIRYEAKIVWLSEANWGVLALGVPLLKDLLEFGPANGRCNYHRISKTLHHFRRVVKGNARSSAMIACKTGRKQGAYGGKYWPS
jgi:hypothetical protein